MASETQKESVYRRLMFVYRPSTDFEFHVTETVDRGLSFPLLTVLAVAWMQAWRSNAARLFREGWAGGYTLKMDRVRFGRALGFGARQAVKTLTTAVDAATAPNPAARNAVRGTSGGQGAAAVHPTSEAVAAVAARKAAQTAARTVTEARQVKQGLGHGSRRFGEAVWRPFVRLGGVLWLEVSGVFFGMFALLALGYVWKLRGAWHAGVANAGAHRSLLGALAMLAMFGYFCVSNFLRARRRERGR